MINNRYVWLAMMVFVSVSAFAQKAERDHIRKGNRFFKDSVYVDAEVNYLKALEANPQSTIAMFNLGNTFLWQNKLQEAMDQYVAAARIEKDKGRKADIFHNIGVVFHSQKEYAKQLNDQQKNQQNQNQQNQEQQQQKQDQQQQKQQNQNQENQQQPPQSEKRDSQMSKENAEQMLNSVMQDEQNTQEKVKKQQVIQGSRLEKDW